MTKRALCIGLLLLGWFYSSQVIAQKKHISVRDSLDHAFDLSSYIIDANGFVPVPVIITEPALGGFGGALAPVFIKKQKPIVKGDKVVPVPPDITVGFGMYTANNSWFAGAGRFGTIRKWGIRYRVFAGYGDINMSFYKTLPTVGEKEFEFNMKVVPVYLFAEKQIGISNWFAGMQYIYGHTKLALRNNDKLPDWVTDKEVSSNVSELGAVIEYDSRDNIFTPDKGLKAHAHFNVSNSIFGSDYNYERLNSFMYWYQPLAENKATGKNWISGLRFDYQNVFGNAPFYLLPFIDMRGIPSARYQGKINALIETEQRWDFTRRWSSVFFGGVGKAFNEFSDFGSADWVYSYGIGGRYLLARKLKLRVGVDLARGPEKFAYYIVFGSSWIK
ncbi:MAG: hypothetical protein J0I41_20945 [Filimonas sp.]|nr:hypothetical protein [Filimonas sp.]